MINLGEMINALREPAILLGIIVLMLMAVVISQRVALNHAQEKQQKHKKV